MKTGISSKHLVILLASSITALFLFFRWYKIDTSLLFFNDIGRDYLVLLNWQESGKPPLLGPQTSALPYNQSAIYFYLLFPLFFLTGHSPYASLLTVSLFYLASFWLGLYWAKNNRQVTQSLLAVGLMIAIHPQFIAQSRFVWNPSFVAPCLIAAFYFFHRLRRKWSNLYLVLFSLSLATATALTYSIAPLFIAWMAYSLVVFGKKSWKIYISTALSLVVVNLPTLFFELRHRFFLTKLLIEGEKLEQVNLSWGDKLQSLAKFSLEINPDLLVAVLIFTLAAMVGLAVFEQGKLIRQNKYLVDAGVLLLATIIITLIVPVAIQKHYVFGVISMGLLVISFLPRKFLLLSLLVLAGFWLHPHITQGYFRPVHRTVQETQHCAEKLCAAFDQPFFVSVQAGYHPYHNGMEFKYFFKEAGCQVKELDTEIDQADYMVVVVDDSEYTHGRTAYNELTQFGASEQIDQLTCQSDLELRLLRRI